MTSFAKYFCAVGLAGMAVIAFASQAVQQLVIDGSTVSTSVTQANGRNVVPVDDVAKYLGYAVSVSGSRINLTRVAIPIAAKSKPNGDYVLESQISTGAASETSMTNTATAAQSSQILPKLPMNIKVAVGKSASVNGFDYAVTSVQDAGATYKETFDQRGNTFHPRWKTDSLVVISIEVTNRGTAALAAILPNTSEITVFDASMIGYQATALDRRQSSDVITTGSDEYSSGSESGNSGLILGSGGTIHFAAIASLPKGDRVASITIKLPGSDLDSSSSAGTIITINR